MSACAHIHVRVHACMCASVFVCVHMCAYICKCVHVQQRGHPTLGQGPLCWVRPPLGRALPGSLQETGGVALGWGHAPSHGTQPTSLGTSPQQGPSCPPLQHLGSFRLSQNLSPCRGG